MREIKQAPMSEQKSFLSHVNGMRALAILGIVFYHLNAAYCPTGYFGVDVFLVISGYFLLASLMKAEKPGDIHYGSYLLKKSWRIIPSWLLVACVFCVGSGWFMIGPDRVEICNTAARSAFFGADFYIDRLYDYFNQKAHQNLFLHFWYLSLICQMYIILPLVVMLALLSRSKRVVGMVLGVMGLLSLCLYVLTTTPQVPEGIRHALLEATGMKSSYYHLLPRLWEILAGGVVFLLPAWSEKRHLCLLLETLAVVVMVASFFCFETGSAQVYLAAISSVLFIRYGGEGWVSRLLSWRPIQWVGTISFSLYLWHWPIMAAWKYVKLGDITWCDELGMVALSFLTAAIMWRWIECLKMPKSPSRLMVAARFIPLALLVAFACGIRPYYKSIKASSFDGMIGLGLIKEMFEDLDARPCDEALLKGLDRQAFPKAPGYIGSNEQAAPSFLLIGDSHAVHSFPGLHQQCMERGLRGAALNNGVFPFWWCYMEGNWSEAKAESLLEYLRQQPSMKYVFISLLWRNRLCGTAKDNSGPTLDWRGMKNLNTEEQIALRKEGLAETCRRLTEMGKKVILLSDVPMLPPNLSPYQLSLKHEMLRGEKAPEYLTPVETHQREAACYFDVLTDLVEKGQARAVIDCAVPFRKGDVYRTRNDEGQFLYTDNNHITYVGSNVVGAYIMQEWERVVREDEEAESAASSVIALPMR